MTRKTRRPPPSHPVNHERWLVSYADFITLLFAFFTTMYAISTVDAKKLGTVANSMQTAFAVQQADRHVGPGGMPQKLLLPVPPQRGERPDTPRRGDTPQGLEVHDVKAQLDDRLAAQVASGLLDLQLDPRGLVVSIREAGAFATGRSDLSPVVQEVLSELARALSDVGNFVRVEGHTDDVPIRNERFGSNWELSTARATAVVAFMLERGVLPERLSAAGYGEFHPRAANDSDANRARNRRVDVVVLNPTTEAREEPGASARPTAAAPAEPAPAAR